jgi:nucleoid-associated protein YgaU
MNRAIVGLGLAAVAGAAFLLSEGEAKAADKAPDGTDLGALAATTTAALVTQNIAGIRSAVAAWQSASDPLTAGALQFTLDGALAGQALAQSLADGEKGSPMLRAFGLRIQQLEGRPELLLLWAKAWKSILPNLALALETKARGIKPSVEAGTKADPIPSEAMIKKIVETLASGDPAAMRALAAELEKAGFKEQAKDLRAAADEIEKGRASTKSPGLPDPVITPAPKPQPVPPAPDPVTTPPAPAPSNGRTYVVKKGDNPSKIAKAFTGNANRWPELVKANVPPKKKAKDGNFATLNAGETLKLPANWPATPPPAAQAAPVTPSPSNGRTYVVRSGDNPSKIAQAFTGNANRWTELVAANSPPKKRAANGNFATLNAGETLKLPANWPAAPGGTAAPPVTSTPAALPAGKRRVTTVQSGDGFTRITKRLGQPESRWRELRDANVPKDADGRTRAKDTDTKGGIKPILQPGHRLIVPSSWPDGPGMVVGADGMASDPAIRAARIALMAKHGRVKREELAAWQDAHGVVPNGEYGPATALALVYRYGIVPPNPLVWGSNGRAAREEYAKRLAALAKHDPQRADEYQYAARRALN